MRNNVVRRVNKARARNRQQFERYDYLRGDRERATESIRILSFVQKLNDVSASAPEGAPAIPQAAPLNAPSDSHTIAPPQLGERILLLILAKEERVNIPGDLAEEFAEIAAKHGVRFAKVWYYKQAVISAWPMLRKAVRWGLLAWIEEFIRQRV